MSPDTLTLALDISSNTGWALCRPSDLLDPAFKPLSGAVRLGMTGATPQEKGWAFIQWLGEAVSFHKPRMLIYEAPLPTSRPQGGSTNSTAFMLIGLAFLAGAVANGFGCYHIDAAYASTVRKHFIGKGNVQRSQAKALTIKRCQELGWTPKTDDEADALALLHWQCSQVEARIAKPGIMPELIKPSVLL